MKQKTPKTAVFSLTCKADQEKKSCGFRKSTTRWTIMAKDPIKKADNGTYYFRANLGYNPITGKQIQKYRSGFRTKKEAKEEYSKLAVETCKRF